jgi:hypothetical protein
VKSSTLTKLARLERRERTSTSPTVEDRERFAWYDASCPCGVPAGECREHPRARAAQRPPAGDWRAWLFQAGRGAGKTRAGAQWVTDRVTSGKARRIALVAPTASDVRDVMIEKARAACWPSLRPGTALYTNPGGGASHGATEPSRPLIARMSRNDFAARSLTWLGPMRSEASDIRRPSTCYF